MTEYAGRGSELYRIAGLCLKAERQAQGLTQAQLGARLGMTNVSLSYIERGLNRLSLDTLLQACAILGTDPVDMLRQIIRMTPDVPRETSRSRES